MKLLGKPCKVVHNYYNDIDLNIYESVHENQFYLRQKFTIVTNKLIKLCTRSRKQEFK